MGGCLHSRSLKEGGQTHRRPDKTPPEIPSQRRREAEVHFGLTTHTVLKALGKGGTGETFLCARTDTHEKEAVKVIRRPLPKILKDMVANEIIIQAQLGEGHFNLVNAHEVLLTDTHLCLMLEFAAGGTLTDFVSNRYKTAHERGGLFLSEDEARYYFQQCIDAVHYCHSHNTVHRDLKLDNVLLDTHSPPYIKICDFGFARMAGGGTCHTLLGTPVYTAPQVIEHKPQGYDGRAADVWACGVLLFAMLLGAFPFENDLVDEGDDQVAFKEVLYEQVRVHWAENPHNRDAAKRVSPEAHDLLDRIFEIDEKKRISVPEIKAHPWFTQPLVEPYASAAARLKARQELINKEVGLVPDSVKDARASAIKALVEAACRPAGAPGGDEPALNLDIVLKNSKSRPGRHFTPIEDPQYDDGLVAAA